MRISLRWLGRYVKFNITPEALAEKLALVGLEVEGIEYLGKQFEGFVVGEVLSVRKHPNADRLTVCSVQVASVGKDPLQIVCGAPNVAQGQKVAVGLAGAVVPRNQHDPEGKPFTLTKAKVRGEESNGMICSEYELGLGTDSKGILVLSGDAKVGETLAMHLGFDDVVLDVSVTPNRPDCLSHLGVAREVAAILKKKLVYPKILLREKKKDNAKKSLSVEVRNKKDCPRYSARIVRDVVVGPSPKWLQSSLRAVGVRPINNIVDITNYVMYESGQPLHAFDAENIRGNKIIVRSASEGEKFTTLDEKEHELTASTLMICDAERTVAIAGVMGGLNSEISASTKTVVIESAYFDATSVRKTAKRLGISTDASYRFERGTDPEGTVAAADRAAALMAEVAGGKVLQEVLDVRGGSPKDHRIALRIDRANQLLGTKISGPEMKEHLLSIGIKVRPSSKGVLTCQPPSYRPDLIQEVDLIEEIARLHGYAKIEDKMTTTFDLSNRVAASDAHEQVRGLLEGMGFNEVVNNSLVDESIARIFSDNIVTIKNPISRELSAMRPSSLCGLLQTVHHNANHGTKDLRIFEIGKTYEKGDGSRSGAPVPGYSEKYFLSLCLCGRKERLSWGSSDENVDIFEMKGVVRGFLGKILLDKFRFIYYDSRSALTEQTIVVEKDGTYIGFLGKVKPELLKKFSIENDVYVSELNLVELISSQGVRREFFPSSKFPTVTRDLAFILDKNVPGEDVDLQIRQSAGPLLKDLVLFDVFEGEPLKSEKKSFAFSLQLNSSEKTLTEHEAEAVIQRVVKSVTEKFGAELRSVS